MRLVLPGAFLVALAGLLVQALAPFAVAATVTGLGVAAGPYVLLFGALAAAGLGLASLRDPARRRRLRREAWLIPCALAPLAALAPWAIAPTPLGPSYGSLPFFLAWLPRHATLGPESHEVLLGIGAVLGACALPACLALHALGTRRPAPRVVAPLAVLQLVAYVPVLVRLDLELLAFAAAVARDGLPTIVGPVEASGWSRLGSALVVASGALLRLAATAVTLAFVPASLRAEEPLVVWETA